MARTAIARQQIVRSGLATSLAAADAANGMYFPNNGSCYLHVKNAGGGACTVTISNAPNIGPDGLAVTARTVVVPATTGDSKIGPFPPNVYNQADGSVYVDFSTATGVTVGVFSTT